MALEGSFNTCKNPYQSIKSSIGPRPSLVKLACVTRALKKMTLSSHTLQRFLSSATLMHPEMYDSSESVDMSQNIYVKPLLGNTPHSPSSMGSKPSSPFVESDEDSEKHIRSAVSSQRHLTYPPTSKIQYGPRESLELKCNSEQDSDEILNRKADGTTSHHDTKAAGYRQLQAFPDKPIRVHSSQMIHQHEIAPMVELHMLSWEKDRFVRRLQRNQVSRAEIVAMKTMLRDRVTSAVDSVLIARLGESESPADIVGWLCCSIIRHQRNIKVAGSADGLRSLNWNVETAIRLNKGYNSGSRTYLCGDQKSLQERNDLIEVFCKGTRLSQRMEFQDQDFIAVTNLVVHPNYNGGHTIRKELLLKACGRAARLGIPVYTCVSEENFASMYKDDCGFTELGEHVNLSFEPEYRWKYLVHRHGPKSEDLLNTQRTETKSNFFGFGRGDSDGSSK